MNFACFCIGLLVLIQIWNVVEIWKAIWKHVYCIGQFFCGCFCWSNQWFFVIMTLLHDSIVLCNYFLVFDVAGVGWFCSLTGKNGMLSTKIHTNWWSVWVIQITNPYDSYGSLVHTDQWSVWVFVEVNWNFFIFFKL